MANQIAVIKTGGKQYKVRVGQVIRVEKINQEPGQEVKFETLLVATTDGQEVKLGTPSLGQKVSGKIIEQGRGRKITVIKFKNKIRYLRTKGHRQPYTKVEITQIAA